VDDALDNDWRLAFMFDARDGDLSRLESMLRRSTEEIVQSVGDAKVRLGVVDSHPDVTFMRQREPGVMRSVDGAIEINVAASRASDLPNIAQSLRDTVKTVSSDGSLEILTGPVFSIVPVREGEVFLSLAFRRDSRTTSEEFRRWWLRQHSVIAAPVLGAGLLAYDQMHVEAYASEAIAFLIGVRPAYYDAYDNLTWADRDAFPASISDEAGMDAVVADEVGRIDNTSRRRSLMRRIA
jgi:hypothetical protein